MDCISMILISVRCAYYHPKISDCRLTITSVYNVLQPGAEMVEFCHRVEWEECTKDMPDYMYIYRIFLTAC